MPANKRSIPELIDVLHTMANDNGLDDLHVIADELRRRAPIKRAKNRSRRKTPELGEEIRKYVSENPNLSQQEVGLRLHVNHGRVSEALNHLF